MAVSQRQRPARYAPTPWAEQRLYRPFVRAAVLVALVLGFVPGVVLLIELAIGSSRFEWSEWTRLHGLAQVYGWAGLFIIGIASHIVPRFRGNARIAFPWPQRAILWLVLGGIALHAAVLIADLEQSPRDIAVVVASLMLFAAMITFAVTLGGVLTRGAPSPVPFERWLWCGLAFAVASAGLHSASAFATALPQSTLEAGPLREAFIACGMFGFAGNFLLGVSLRATAGFLHLRPYHAHLERLSFVLVNSGVLVMTATLALDATVVAVAVGTLAYAVGVAVFIVAMRVFEPPAGERSDPRSTRFLLVGFAWLVIAAVLLAFLAVRDAVSSPLVLLALPALHTYAVGFVTVTIFGFAVRVLPLLEGRPLPAPRLLDVAFVLLNASVILRLLGALDQPGASTHVLALSGCLALAALLCFVPVVWPLSGGRTLGEG